MEREIGENLSQIDTLSRQLKELDKEIDLKERDVKRKALERKKKEEELVKVLKEREKELEVCIKERSDVFHEKEKEFHKEIKELKMKDAVLMKAVEKSFSVLKEKNEEMELKQKSLEEQTLELNKKEKELMKVVEEREKKSELHEVWIKARLDELHEKEKEFDLKQESVEKQIQEAQVIRSALEKQKEELVIQFNEQEKMFQDSLNGICGELLGELQATKEKVDLISKFDDEKSCELERTVKEFDMKQVLETESRRKEAELMEDELREKLSKLEKKEREIKERSNLLDLKEKKLDKTSSKLEKKEREEAIKFKEKSKLLDRKEKELDQREINLALQKNEIKERLENIKSRKRTRLEVGTSSNKGREHDQNDEVRVTRRKARYDTQSEHTNEANTTEIDEVICIDLHDKKKFHHFNKTMESFRAGQVWALYEPLHLMPRYYAVIKKILQSELSLRVHWLEPENTIVCGDFKYGKQNTQRYISFSHEMHYIKQGRNIVTINPRKGETWALFSEHRKPASCKCEFVEIMTDFDSFQGVRVTYLQSVEGFTSVYERVEQHGVQMVISANEMHKFSHNVPSFKLTGAEREGVPPGSFELDPAAIPRASLKAADKV